MSVVAVAIVGSAVVGAAVSSNSAAHAATNAHTAAAEANSLAEGQYNQTRSDEAPWRQAGVSALNNIQNQSADLNRSFTMADFQKDPGYQFRMDEANKAIERSAAAHGNLGSGATMKALTRYNQDYAANQFQTARNNFTSDQDRRFNQYASLAGLGQTATAQTNAAGNNYANTAGNNITGAANVSNAADTAQANAINNTLGTGMNTWMQMQMMNRYAPTQSTQLAGTSSPY